MDIGSNTMAETIPQETKSLPLGVLHLPSRSHNPLERMGITTLGDLFSLSDSELGVIPKLGTTNLRRIQDIKSQFLDSIAESGSVNWFQFWKISGIEIIPHDFDEFTPENKIIGELPSIIQEILAQNTDERLWFILQRRLGLEGTEKLTLEELGLAFGLTRERVRQLEASALNELRGVLIEDDYKNKTYHVHPNILKAVRRLSEMVTDRAGQATLESSLLNQIQHSFNVHPDAIKPSLYLVLNLSGLLKLDFNRGDLQPVWGKFGTPEARSIQNSIERLDKLMTEEHTLPLSEIDILVQINKGVRKRNRLSLDQLKKLLNLCSSIEVHKSGFYWGKFGHLVGRGNQVERVLFEHGEPVHITKITREINHRLTLHGKRIVNPRNLANQMSNDNRFVPIGRSGEWGLSSWSVDTGTIVEQMKLYFIARNEPATADEIYSYVSERRPVRKGSVEAYLTFQEDFAKVDRIRWGLAEWSEVKDAQNWNPEQVGQFVEELFRKNRSRKLKYQIIKQALMEASGVKNRQAQGLLNINPVIRTERDETGELYAIFQPKYRELLDNAGGARFTRKKKTLRVLVDETVRKILETSPGNQIALSELVNLLVEKYKKRDKTFYHYISDLDFIEKFTIPDTRKVMCRFKQEDSSLPFPQVDVIQTAELRQKVGRALTFLNENDVDISLFLLSKEFEATLKCYLITGQSKGEFLDLPSNRLSLDGMINFIKSRGIITDQSVLHFLRQKRNDRAHGTMPVTEERKMMMKHAQTTAGMYIDYIKYLDDLTYDL
jgi:hypothetical protein